MDYCRYSNDSHKFSSSSGGSEEGLITCLDASEIFHSWSILERFDNKNWDTFINICFNAQFSLFDDRFQVLIKDWPQAKFQKFCLIHHLILCFSILIETSLGGVQTYLRHLFAEARHLFSEGMNYFIGFTRKKLLHKSIDVEGKIKYTL